MCQQPFPTQPVTMAVTETPLPTEQVIETAAVPTSTLEPPPASAVITSPEYEQQKPNNCGPAALSMMMHIYGWNGSQLDISEVIKPVNGDRNVNPEEMA